MQVSINDCTINELIFTLYNADLLDISVTSDLFTTSFVAILVGSDLTNKFGEDMPC